ncbi:DUF6531 domain-containing protein [Kitasatospora sp. NBC_01287]|uniref:DUF6531 domain-containing protein n=1 Tax=Kitasatospora sp. NBC_01287 TaxID=2903573 RepID=UPI002251C033|nr:DUF6531 domain-containing protein [Kitasatospora sp. NBC_01287]MCX4745456.1 DUF6531 domain-containing protein [Kitasatospora sp. NBC_01287]
MYAYHFTLYSASDNQQVYASSCQNTVAPDGTAAPFWADVVTMLNPPARIGGGKLQAGVGYYGKLAASHTNPGAARNSGDWSCDTGWSSEVQTATFTAYSNGQSVPAAETSGCGCADSSGRDSIQGHRGDPVNTLSLAEDEQATDISLSAPGVPFVLNRTYASDHATIQNGVFGAQWTFPYSARVQDSSSSVQVTLEDGSVAAYNRGSSGNLTPVDGVRSTLTGNSASGYTMTTPDKQILTFGTSGRLQTWTDLNGIGLTVNYQGSTATTPSSITDAAGHTATLAFDPSTYLLTKVSLSDGRSVSYGYTSRLLTSVTGLDGGTTVYGYDTGGLLNSITDPAGHQVMSTTYTNGLVSSQTDANGRTLKFSGTANSNSLSNYSSYTDANGGIWSDIYSGGELYRSIDPLGNQTNYAYDSNLHLSQVLDAQGHFTQLLYDPAGHMTSRILPDGSTESWTYNSAGDQTSHTTPSGAKTTSAYDTANRLISQIDPAGGTTFYTYTTNGQLASQTSPAHRTTRYSYDGAGNLTSVTDAAGNRTSYTYDADGDRQSVTDPRGNVAGADPTKYTTTYTFDAAGRLLTSTDPTGGKALYSYDGAGNRISVTDPLGNRATSTYDNAHRLLTSTDPAGNRSSYTYDANGNQLTATDPTGATTSSTYDADNNRLTLTTARGNAAGATAAAYTTSYTYDSLGNLTSTTDPSGAVTKTTYDAFSRPVTAVDALGNTTTSAYDADGNLLSTTDPTGAATTNTYDPHGLLASSTDPLGHTSSYTYDADGNRVSATTAAGSTTTWTYGPGGQVSSTVDPRGNATGATASNYTTNYGYDPAGNQTTVTDPLGNTTTTVVDALDRTTSVTDPLGNATGDAYDADGNLVKVTAPTGAATTYSFDADGNILTRTDANSHTTSYAYDADGRPASVADPLGHRTSYSYDLDGNRTTAVDARGIIATTGYDARSLPTGTTYSDSTSAVAYTYDAGGRLLTGCSAPATSTGCLNGSALAYTYDAVGNRLTQTSGAATTNYTYDAADELTQAATGSTTTSYAYDADGDATSAKTPAASATITAGNGLASGASISSSSARLTMQSDGNLVLSSIASGQVLWSSQTGGHPGATATMQTDGNFVVYDTAKNALWNSKTWPGNGAVAVVQADSTFNVYDRYIGLQWTSNTPDPIAAAGGVSYTYDGAGNQASETLGATTYSYTYDASGNRTTAKANGTVTGAIQWDPNAPLPQIATETDATGAVKADYTYNPTNQVESEQTATGTFYAHHDWLGSVTDLTDATGTQQVRYGYDTYGARSTSAIGANAPPSAPMGYTGQYTDPTDNQLDLRARRYDTTTGRLTTRDPIQLRPTIPYSGDYTYTNDAPTYLTDPSGQCGLGAKLYDAWHAIIASLGQSHCKAEDDAAAQKTPLAAAAGAHLEQGTEDLLEAPAQAVQGYIDTSTFGLTPSLVPGAQPCPNALAYQAGSLAAILTPWGEEGAGALSVEELRARYKERGAETKVDPRATPKDPIHLALGLDNIGGTWALDKFALERGAVTFKDGSVFGDIVPRGTATESGLNAMIDRTVASGGKISFNLEGMLDLKGVLAGTDYGNGWTSLELRKVCGSPEVRAVTTFFNFDGAPPC